MGNLTAKEVENLAQPGTYEDGEGLRLVVQPTGRKSWVLRFQLMGRRREMGLGGFPLISLKEARLKAAVSRRLLMDGIDPLAARDGERVAALEAQRSIQAKKYTFEHLAREYFEAHSGDWSDSWRKGWIRKLEIYVFGRIGKLLVQDVSTDEVLAILRPIWMTKSRTADEVRSQIEQVLDAAKARNLRQGENPAQWRGHLANLLSRAEKKKTRKRVRLAALPWRDAPELLAKLKTIKSRDSFAMQLLILTGARSHMVRFARWDEFDLNARTWSLPPEFNT